MPLTSLLFAGLDQNLTSFFSLAYITGFLPLALIIYSIVPKKCKRYALLAESCLFFWLISGTLIMYLLIAVFTMHYFGLWLDRIQTKMREECKAVTKDERPAIKEKFNSYQRRVVWLSAAILIGILLTLKYTAFFDTNINLLLEALGVKFQLEIPKYLLPIGISFFTMQAMSYILDVYHGVIKADENIVRLWLFIAFFPQIVEGPICRYSQTADQLWDAKPIRYKNLTFGIQRILYGMMKKIVVADRLDTMVGKVFDNYPDHEGGIIALAAVLYTIQLYMDFSGSMDAVMGTAEIFGINMPENFNHPFFSRTVSEFWTRWHISLGAWFKDYIFYPVTTSKRMKKLTSNARKKLGNHYGPLIAGSIALFCVWFCNGLWHGSDWNFIFFGMYHFVIILIGSIIGPTVKSVNQKLRINSDNIVYRVLQIARTCILVVVGELFFRANGIVAGLEMFKTIVTDFTFNTFGDDLFVQVKLDRHDLLITGITCMIVFGVSLANEKGIKIRETLAKKSIVLRWAVLYALIMYIIIFGAYGMDYVPVDPLYAQF